MTDEWGIADGYHDIGGTWHPVDPEVRDALRTAMGDPPQQPAVWVVRQGERHRFWSPCMVELEQGDEWGPLDELPPDVPVGIHDLVPLDGGATTLLMVAPARLQTPAPTWGLAIQLYSLWSAESQGIGDVADLATVLDWLASWGAGAVLLSPLLAPVLSAPIESSPYFPSTRRFLNPLHLRVPGVAATAAPLVDRSAVWQAKRAALFGWFLQTGTTPGWRRWAERQGSSLVRYGAWCAAVEQYGPNWRQWPEPLQQPTAFDDVTLDDPIPAFHAWCQWLTHRQLSHARSATRDIALIGDLPVGFSPEGFDSWDYQSVLADGCRIGAPPDPFSQSGQDWGLPPFVPGQLRAQRFEPLRETLRASFSLFDGLRIDHVMGLFRQWWIPPGGTATDGAYVRFPSEELLAVVAIEAHRSGSFVIGEDLGTVEDGVREAMASWGVLGTRVMWFEDRPPSEWPVNALGTVTTHDLPTIAGVWRGIEGDPALVPQICDVTGLQPTAPTAAVVAALHERLARSPAAIRLATLDDVCEAPLRPNVPGTVEPTNWSRPLPVAVEELVHSPRVRSAMLPFTSQAPRGSTGGPLSPERRQP